MVLEDKIVKYEVDVLFIEICKQIVAENKSLEEWYEVRSDDMFQNEKYCGGFESMENEFTFSLFDENGCEYWFQLSLEEIKNIVYGNLSTVNIRPADT